MQDSHKKTVRECHHILFNRYQTFIPSIFSLFFGHDNIITHDANIQILQSHAKTNIPRDTKNKDRAMTNLCLFELNHKLFLNTESFLHKFRHIQDLSSDNLRSAGKPSDVLVDQIGERNDGRIARRVVGGDGRRGRWVESG